MTEIVVLLVVLAAATAFGLWRRAVDGRFRSVRESMPGPPSPGPADRAELPSAPETAVVDAATPTAAPAGFEPADLGAELGSRATFVQFSSAFCQPCRATRATLAHLAAQEAGVVHVEIDAESRLDLVRRAGVLRTPTTFVLDGSGRVVGRATGVLRLDAARAALP